MQVTIEGIAGAGSLSPTIFAEPHVLDFLVERHEVSGAPAPGDAPEDLPWAARIRVLGETRQPQFGCFLWACSPDQDRTVADDATASRRAEDRDWRGAAPIVVRLLPLPEAFGTLDTRTPFPNDASSHHASGWPESSPTPRDQLDTQNPDAAAPGEASGQAEPARCWASPSAVRCLRVSRRGQCVLLFPQAAARPAVWPAAVVRVQVALDVAKRCCLSLLHLYPCVLCLRSTIPPLPCRTHSSTQVILQDMGFSNLSLPKPIGCTTRDWTPSLPAFTPHKQSC